MGRVMYACTQSPRVANKSFAFFNTVDLVELLTALFLSEFTINCATKPKAKPVRIIITRKTKALADIFVFVAKAERKASTVCKNDELNVNIEAEFGLVKERF